MSRAPRFLPEDKPVPWRRLSWYWFTMGTALVLLLVSTASPWWVEVGFANGLGPAMVLALGTLTGWLPFSLAEIIEIGIALWVIGAPIPALVNVFRGKRRLSNALASGALQLLVLALLAAVLFYATWGLNYARAPLIDRQGWPEVVPDDPLATTEMIWFAEEAVHEANRLYVEIHGSEQSGVPTRPPPRPQLESAVTAGWANAATELDLPAWAARTGPPAKPLASSAMFSFLGISGYFFPFTAEANYNTETPGFQLAHTVAHEKAHQRGFASEDEANFTGFLACIRSPDPSVRYAGWMFAQRRLLFSLLAVEPQVAINLIELRHPGVQDDVFEARKFWASKRGRATEVSRAVNDAYLRANRVRGGIDSYALSTELLLSWGRQRGGSLSR